MNKYNHREIEKHWQDVWQKEGIYKAKDFAGKKKYYLLVEYPYPSGEGLHIGHAFTNTIGDVYARMLRMKGLNVLFPMGWDSFGLPTENSAIKLKINPAVLTKRNTARFKQQNISLGMGFDWDREIDTSEPDYYKWTQWIFLQLFKHGLAYKGEAKVGWCPRCRIILANEEIIAGKCERCGTVIEYREQKQWILKITDYADRLADELEGVDYPDYVVKSQRDWVGRKEWIDIKYDIEGTDRNIVVSTTRPDTNFGATFIVVAPEHEVVDLLLKGDFRVAAKEKENVKKYVELSKSKSELERISEGREKTGVFTGLYAVNGLIGSKMPIYVTDFVLPTVGTGAVVGVPGHDKRDFEFAKKFNLPVIRVVVGKDGNKGEIERKEQVLEEDGVAINSGFLDGLDSRAATKKIMDYLEKRGLGKRVVRYHLRDWIFSRQHYWGEPIPIIHCPKCGMVPVPEEELPVRLPDVKKYEPTDTGESPLAKITSWVKVKCPKCGGPAQRETDTMPNWAGSSWYYLRYLDPKNQKGLAEGKKLDYWMPVDVYIGGAEHNTLHLLYSRFWHKFLNDIKVVPCKEPYRARRQHGVILGEDGRRMSKSRGNVINPLVMAEKFGADTLRLYLMFMGPYDSTITWNTEGIEGMSRFVSHLWRLFQIDSLGLDEKKLQELTIKMHQTIKKVTEDIEQYKYNTAIAQLMIFVNFLQGVLTRDTENKTRLNNQRSEVWNEALKTLCLIISPFAPHLSEEVWQEKFKTEKTAFKSIHQESWPKFDPELIKEEKVTIAVQVNGKLRGTLQLPSEQAGVKDEVVKEAKEDTQIVKWLLDKPKKVVFIPGKLVNFVI